MRGDRVNNIIFAGKHFLTYSVNRHQHDTWELIYCTGETGKFVFADLELPYSEGDVVVIPPNVPHENVSDHGFTNVHLNIGDATLAFRRPVVIRDDGNQSLLHLFSDAYYLFRGDPERRAALLSAYGDLIVRMLITYGEKHPKNRVAEMIEQSIRQNYANANYELDEVLHTMPYCYDHLCKVFRKEMGTTPHKYLTNLRLQAAADTLCSGYNNGNITEVAHMCGFHNPLYLSRLFKKKYGVSPREYYHLKMEEEAHASTDSDSQKITVPE